MKTIERAKADRKKRQCREKLVIGGMIPILPLIKKISSNRKKNQDQEAPGDVTKIIQNAGVLALEDIIITPVREVQIGVSKEKHIAIVLGQINRDQIRPLVPETKEEGGDSLLQNN